MMPLILAYHSVSDGRSSDFYSVSRKTLADQLCWLADAGYEFVSLESLVRRQQRKPAVLTFDDGYRDFLTCAFPILQRRGVPGTAFLVTDMLGKTAQWDGDSNRTPLMTAAEAREVKAGGISLGSHTLTHANLTTVRAGELQRQLVASRQALADLGETFFSLSYPWGRCTKREAVAAQAAGYQCAVTAGRSVRSDVYRLGRLVVNRNLDLTSFGRAVLQFEKNKPIAGVLRAIARTAKLRWHGSR